MLDNLTIQQKRLVVGTLYPSTSTMIPLMVLPKWLHKCAPTKEERTEHATAIMVKFPQVFGVQKQPERDAWRTNAQVT